MSLQQLYLRTAARALTVLLASFVPAGATPITTWNVVGYWNLLSFVENGYSDWNGYITTEDFGTGAVTGTNSHGDILTGSVVGSAIDLYMTGYGCDTFGECAPWHQAYEGTIAADGTMSGDMQAESDLSYVWWHGTFWTASGAAVDVEMPEPPGLAVLGFGLLGLVGFLRHTRRTA